MFFLESIRRVSHFGMRKYTIDISCPSQDCDLYTSFTHRRAVTRFFCNGGRGGGLLRVPKARAL